MPQVLLQSQTIAPHSPAPISTRGGSNRPTIQGLFADLCFAADRCRTVRITSTSHWHEAHRFIAEHLLAHCSHIPLSRVGQFLQKLPGLGLSSRPVIAAIGHKLCQAIKEVPERVEIEAAISLLAAFAATQSIEESSAEPALTFLAGRRRSLNAQQIYRSVVACGQLGFVDSPALIMLIDEAFQRPETFTRSQLAGLAWTSAVIGGQHGRWLWDRLQTANRFSAGTLSVEEVEREYHAAGALGKVSEADTTTYGTGCYTHTSGVLLTGSRFEEEVQEQLRLQPLRVMREYSFRGYLIDFLVQSDCSLDKAVALEVDGSCFHLIAGSNKRRLRGKDIVKQRFLEQHGFKVVRLSDTIWERAESKQALLQKLLEPHLGYFVRRYRSQTRSTKSAT